MSGKGIARVDGTAKGAAISKYSPDRQGRESGRRQQSSDSYKPEAGKKESESFDKFFAKAYQKAYSGCADFESLLKKVWEDNKRMQESAKNLWQTETEAPIVLENAWMWALDSRFRPIAKI